MEGTHRGVHKGISRNHVHRIDDVPRAFGHLFPLGIPDDGVQPHFLQGTDTNQSITVSQVTEPGEGRCLEWWAAVQLRAQHGHASHPKEKNVLPAYPCSSHNNSMQCKPVCTTATPRFHHVQWIEPRHFVGSLWPAKNGQRESLHGKQVVTLQTLARQKAGTHTMRMKTRCPEHLHPE